MSEGSKFHCFGAQQQKECWPKVLFIFNTVSVMCLCLGSPLCQRRERGGMHGGGVWQS